MAHRANITYIHADGTADITTVQWATYLDVHLRQILDRMYQNSKNASPVGLIRSFDDLAREFIADLTSKYDHLDSIQTFPSECHSNSDIVTEFAILGAPRKRKTIAAVPYDRTKAHMEGIDPQSIAVSYDERTPGFINFSYWKNDSSNETGRTFIELEHFLHSNRRNFSGFSRPM